MVVGSGRINKKTKKRPEKSGMWGQQRLGGGTWLMGVLVHWIVKELGVGMNEWKGTNVAGIAGNRKA